MRTLNGLIYSRKFWLAVAGSVQTILGTIAGLDPAIMISIDALFAVVIVAIAVEDAGEKIGGRKQ